MIPPGGNSDPPAGDAPASNATATGVYAQLNLAPGIVLADRFRLESILGIGGMGVVYRATDLTLDVPVALKLLRPELAQRADAFDRFRDELLLARQVSHPHVVRIHDLARHGQHWLISMDFVDGTSLDHRIDKQGPLAVEEALQVTRQLAEGLAAAHAKGVVHRDLKPANVLLDAQDNAYISDFGVARSLITSGLTQSGTVVGTPDYLSPEQARGDPVDARSDLYALGLILYEMLAGKPPFGGGTMAEVLAQRIVSTPQPIVRHRPEVPAWVARLLDKLLRPQPAHRFQSAAAVVLAIDTREVPRELRLSRGVGWGLAAMLALALGVGGWWLQHEPGPVIAASPPLQRLLVLPIEHAGDGSSSADTLAPKLAGLSAHLRDALAAIPGFAVVDGERTQQALRQLDPAGAARPDVAGLRTIAAAQRVLQPTLVAEDGRWHLRAQLHSGTAAPVVIDGPAADGSATALRAWADQASTRRALGLRDGASIRLTLPTESGALDAHGAGLLARQGGKLDEALEKLRAATTSAPGYAAAWLAQAETALAIGELDTAFDAIEHGQRAAIDAPASLRRRFAAELALLEGNPTAAVAEWRALLAATPDDTFAELQLARAQGAGGDFSAAVEGLQTLVQRDANDPRAWFELGKFTLLSGDAQRAVDDHLVRALVLYKRSRDAYGEAETVNALGIGYARLGQTADAIEQYRKAVDLRRAVGNRRGVATSLRNLANALALTGRFDEAADHLEQARALHAELGDQEGLAATENELGLLAEERGDYRGALAAYRRALQIWQRAGDVHGNAQALNNIGFAHYQLGAYNDAQVYWQQAAEAYAELGSLTGQIRTEQNLGLLATARGHWDDARRRLKQSLTSAEQQQMPEEAAVSRRNLAELELLQGHLAAAIEQTHKAETLFRQREDQRGVADAGLLRARALLAAHADTEARALLDALQPTLAQASTEQRAIAQLLRSKLATRTNGATPATAMLRQAREWAANSGVRHLQLQIALHEARAGIVDGEDLDAATTTLGHAGLRLGWLEWAMQRALGNGDPTAALAAYREAQGLLRGGDFQHAWQVHRLGAEAHTASGNTAEAGHAQARSRDAWIKLREGLPESLRAGFDQSAQPAEKELPR
ncbi:protein kinase domain-containing protein [Lysobacter sp. A289]